MYHSLCCKIIVQKAHCDSAEVRSNLLGQPSKLRDLIGRGRRTLANVSNPAIQLQWPLSDVNKDSRVCL